MLSAYFRNFKYPSNKTISIISTANGNQALQTIPQLLANSALVDDTFMCDEEMTKVYYNCFFYDFSNISTMNLLNDNNYFATDMQLQG